MPSIITQFPAAFLALATICAQTGGELGGGFGITPNAISDQEAFLRVLQALGLKEPDFHLKTVKFDQVFNVKGKFGAVQGAIPEVVLGSSISKDVAKWAAILAIIGTALTEYLESPARHPNAFPQRTLAQRLARRVLGLKIEFPLASAQQPTAMTTTLAPAAPMDHDTLTVHYAPELKQCDLATRTLLAHVPVQACLGAGLALDWAAATETGDTTTVTVFAGTDAFSFVDPCPFRAFAGACQARFLAAQVSHGADQQETAEGVTAEESGKRAHEASGSTVSGLSSLAAPMVPPQILTTLARLPLVFGTTPDLPSSSPVPDPNTPTRRRRPLSKVRRLHFEGSSSSSPPRPPPRPPIGPRWRNPRPLNPHLRKPHLPAQLAPHDWFDGHARMHYSSMTNRCHSTQSTPIHGPEHSIVNLSNMSHKSSTTANPATTHAGSGTHQPGITPNAQYAAWFSASIRALGPPPTTTPAGTPTAADPTAAVPQFAAWFRASACAKIPPAFVPRVVTARPWRTMSDSPAIDWGVYKVGASGSPLRWAPLA